MKAVWCVRHRNGWCAVFDGRCPSEDAWEVPTKCDHFIHLPWACEKRVPTCEECKKMIAARVA